MAVIRDARAMASLPGRREKSVLGMAPADDCMREMFVIVAFAGRKLGVPLARLDPLKLGEAAREAAVEDWGYWGRGYGF